MKRFFIECIKNNLGIEAELTGNDITKSDIKSDIVRFSIGLIIYISICVIAAVFGLLGLMIAFIVFSFLLAILLLRTIFILIYWNEITDGTGTINSH